MEVEEEEIMLMSTHMPFLMCHPVCGSRNDRDGAAGQSVDPWPAINSGQQKRNVKINERFLAI